MPPMSQSLGPLAPGSALTEAVGAYRTCEFATIGKDGTPTAWPTSGIACPDGSFLLTTSLGYPQKAYNVRRDARVALLFSDPTASGRPAPSQILVRGEATCPDQVHVAPEGDLAAFWTMIFARQPGAGRYLDWPANILADFYFMRLLIRVTPTDLTVRDLPSAGGVPDGVAGSGLVGAAVLGAYPSVVLSTRDRDGAPALIRTRLAAASGGYRVEVPDDVPVAPGPAALLVHRHDAKLNGLHNASVAGRLTRDDSGWLLAPERLVEPGAHHRATLTDPLRIARQCRATTRGYLEKRGWERPAIPWGAYRRIRAVASRLV